VRSSTATDTDLGRAAGYRRRRGRKAERERARRAQLLVELDAELAQLERREEDHPKAACELMASRRYGRYLSEDGRDRPRPGCAVRKLVDPGGRAASGTVGVVGTVLATYLRGLDNDVYFQGALLTTIGLSAKNPS
jgi:hypothetical protein